MTFNQILQEVKTSKWQPEFYWEKDIWVVADKINKPHEDYPLGVQKTQEIITIFKGSDRILFSDACQMQKELFDDKKSQIEGSKLWLANPENTYFAACYLGHQRVVELPNQYINLGLRRTQVKVGPWTPPATEFLFDLIPNIFPIYQNSYSKQEMQRWVQWYKIFQTIHPFEDLNGRVGGIIIASLSYHPNLGYLCPVRN